MTYQTNNPVGSVDVRDLYDNTVAFDNFSAGPLDAYPDRLGVMRQSLQGIRNASQYADLGPYAAGLNFTSRNQVFSYMGEFYSPGPSITLPYTTTGIGAGEIANFRSVGDAVLRQDLANDTDPAKGAGLIGWKREELLNQLDTVSTALNANAVNVWEFAGLVVTKPNPLDSETWDWSPAVQAAIDFCHLSFPTRPLAVSTLIRLATPVAIDRPIDGDSVRDTFTILGVDGGGFIVDSAIPMFTTTIPQTVLPDGNLNPSSQTIRLLGLTLTATDASLNAYVLDGNKFLRVWVDGCSISKLKFLQADSYVQTIYLAGNNIRYWQGFFFKAEGGAYDIRVHAGNEIEHGEHFIQLTDAPQLKTVAGCVIDGNVIEGLSGTGIIYAHCRGLAITNNYFEANAGKDISGNDYVPFPNRGVMVSGNYFSQSAGNKLNPAYRSVTWGVTEGGASLGNFCDGNLHSVRPGTQAVFQDSALGGAVLNDPSRFDLSNVAFGSVSPQINNAVYGDRAWAAGNIIINNNPGGTLSMGWICAIAGTPGTWYPMGPLAQPGRWSFADTAGLEHVQVIYSGNGVGQTSLAVRGSDGVTDSIRRVLLGPVDSGGTGYRMLRILN